MKFAIVGAGAVGSFYGAMLARAGCDTCMVGRPDQVAAMRARGITFETANGVQAIPVSATAEPSGVAAADVVLVCVKADASSAVAAGIKPHLKADTTILSLQNGVDTAENLEQALGRAVVPAAVYVAVELLAPGHVKHNGRGELKIGAGPGSRDIAAAFARAGVPTDVSDNVAGDLWAKLIVNCAYNGLSAIGQQPYGPMMAVEGVAETMQEIVDECLRVAERSRVSVPGDVRSIVRALAPSMPGQMSSTAQDLSRGKRTEIDSLNGFVVRRGTQLGIPTPANRAVWTAVKLLESRAVGTS